MMLNILIISVICCCIIDVSGFVEEIENGLTKMMKMKTKARIPKPFCCSLCMTFWTGLLYLIIAQSFTLPYLMYLLIIAVMTPVTTEVILFARGLLMKGIVSLGRWIGI